MALVAGGGSGIGHAASVLFAREGGQVMVADISSKGGNEPAEIVRGAGGEAVFIDGDVATVAIDAKHGPPRGDDAPVKLREWSLVGRAWRIHGAIAAFPKDAYPAA